MIPDGMVICPACDGSGEIEHWTTCWICEEYASKDPRYVMVTTWYTYCPLDVALAYSREQSEVWALKIQALEAAVA